MPKQLLVLCLLLTPFVASAEIDSHHEATVELMEVMRAAEIMDQFYAQFEPMFTGMSDELALTPEQRQMAERQTQETLQIMREVLNWSIMEPYMVEAYMNVYSEEEIREIIAFYRTPTGQKMLDRMPELMQESMRVSQQMIRDVMPRIQALQEELRNELASLE